jgi:Xaa-Pro aminopeptidase
MLAGYEGTLARTLPCTPAAASPETAALAERSRRLTEALVRACRAGASASDLLDAYRWSGEELPSSPIAHGVGLGCEPPLVGAEHLCDPDERLESGMVLSLRAAVTSAGSWSYEAEDVVLIGDRESEMLTPRSLSYTSGR